MKWRNGITTCVNLEDIKEAYPVQLVEYYIASKISMEPAFAWWVPHTFKKRKRTI